MRGMYKGLLLNLIKNPIATAVTLTPKPNANPHPNPNPNPALTPTLQ